VRGSENGRGKGIAPNASTALVVTHLSHLNSARNISLQKGGGEIIGLCTYDEQVMGRHDRFPIGCDM
jgi:hypothetical protein